MAGSGRTASSAGTQDASGNDNNALEGFDENGIPTELSLLAAIPSTEEKKQAAYQKIQRAYMDLSDAYINHLEDLPMAAQALDSFDTRFPDNNHKAEALYYHYQLALKQNKLDLAQNLSREIRNQYVGSKWADLVGPATSEKTLATTSKNVADYYDETYSLMMKRDYPQLLSRVKTGQKQYNNYPVYQNRFKIMEAIALAGTGSYKEADTLLT